MHALQFVQEFAAFTGQDYASLRVIDRALADAGLRAKAKGKSLPDVTLEEGAMFLIAVLANSQPTQAAQAALEIAAARCFAGQAGPQHRDRKSVVMLARIIGCPAADTSKIKLVDVLVSLIRPGAKTWAELTVHRDGPATLSFGRDGVEHADEFSQLRFDNLAAHWEPKPLTETRTAGPDLFRWIRDHTLECR